MVILLVLHHDCDAFLSQKEIAASIVEVAGISAVDGVTIFGSSVHDGHVRAAPRTLNSDSTIGESPDPRWRASQVGLQILQIFVAFAPTTGKSNDVADENMSVIAVLAVYLFATMQKLYSPVPSPSVLHPV